MVKVKATVMLDRKKAVTAQGLIHATSLSETIDRALDRMIRAEQLRRDVATYLRDPLKGAEEAVGDLPVAFDLGDEDVDYEAVYGKRR